MLCRSIGWVFKQSRKHNGLTFGTLFHVYQFQIDLARKTKTLLPHTTQPHSALAQTMIKLCNVSQSIKQRHSSADRKGEKERNREIKAKKKCHKFLNVLLRHEFRSIVCAVYLSNFLLWPIKIGNVFFFCSFHVSRLFCSCSTLLFTYSNDGAPIGVFLFYVTFKHQMRLIEKYR